MLQQRENGGGSKKGTLLSDPMINLERLQRQAFIDQQRPNMRTIWSPNSDPNEYPDAHPDYYQSKLDKDPLFVGAAVIVMSPSFEQPIVAQVAVVHDPATDVAMSISGQDVLFRPLRPRIDALTVIPHEIETFQIVRINKCPHRIDAEHAVMLADGNLANLVNCTYYVAVHTFSAK